MWLNWPRDRYASVPVIFHLELAELVGRIRFGVTRNYSFITFLRNPTTRINVRSEVGNEKYKLKDIPQVSDFIVKKMKQFIKKRFVSPHCHKFRLIWPRNWWPQGTENLFVGVPVQIPDSVTANLPPDPGAAPATTGTTPAAPAAAVAQQAVAGTPAVTATVPAPSVHTNVTPAVVVASTPAAPAASAEPAVQYRFNDYSDEPIAPDSASKTGKGSVKTAKVIAASEAKHTPEKAKEVTVASIVPPATTTVSGTTVAAAANASVATVVSTPVPERRPSMSAATSSPPAAPTTSVVATDPTPAATTAPAPTPASSTTHAASTAAASAYTASLEASSDVMPEEPRFARHEINQMWTKHLRSTAIKMDLSAFHGGSLYDLSDLERAVFVKSFFRYDPILDHAKLIESKKRQREKQKEAERDKNREPDSDDEPEMQEEPADVPDEHGGLLQSPHHPVLDSSFHYEDTDVDHYNSSTSSAHSALTKSRMRRSHSLSEFRGMVLEIALDRFLASMDYSSYSTAAMNVANAAADAAANAEDGKKSKKVGKSGDGNNRGSSAASTAEDDIDFEESEYERAAFSFIGGSSAYDDTHTDNTGFRESSSSPTAAERRSSMSLLGRQSSAKNASAAIAASVRRSFTGSNPAHANHAVPSSPQASIGIAGAGSHSEPRPRRMSDTPVIHYGNEGEEDALTMHKLKAKGKESVAMAKAKFMEFRNKHFHHQQGEGQSQTQGQGESRVRKLGMLKEMLFSDGDASSSSNTSATTAAPTAATSGHTQRKSFTGAAPASPRGSATVSASVSGGVSAGSSASHTVDGDLIDFSSPEQPTAASGSATKRRTSLEPSEATAAEGNVDSAATANKHTSTKAVAMKYMSSMFRSKDSGDSATGEERLSTHGAPSNSTAPTPAVAAPHRLSSSRIDTSAVTGSGTSSGTTAPTTSTGKAASMFAKALSSVRQHMEKDKEKDST